MEWVHAISTYEQNEHSDSNKVTKIYDIGHSNYLINLFFNPNNESISKICVF
jgi:hypothetical protein